MSSKISNFGYSISTHAWSADRSNVAISHNDNLVTLFFQIIQILKYGFFKKLQCNLDLVTCFWSPQKWSLDRSVNVTKSNDFIYS